MYQVKQTCSELEQKQREVAIAAATKLKTLRLRNSPPCTPQLAYVISA